MKLSLRHWQFNAARGGNIQMLIWLGKQYLGQRDTVEKKIESEGVKVIIDV